MNKSRKSLVALALIFLITGCAGRDAASVTSSISGGEPGNGKWTDSDIWGYYESAGDAGLSDDFAAASNLGFAYSKESEDPEEICSTFYDAQDLIYDRYMEIIADDTMEGTPALAMRALGELTFDWDERNKLGAEPLRPYIEEIENISSIDDMTDFMASTLRNPFGLGLISPSSVMPQVIDVDKSMLVLDTPSLSLGDPSNYRRMSIVTLDQREKNDAAVYYLLGRLGYMEKEIDRILKKNYRIETFIAKNNNNYSEYEAMHTQQMDREGLIEKAGSYPIDRILDGRGFGGCDSFCLDYVYLSRLDRIYTERNLEDLKAFFIVHLIEFSMKYLDREAYEKALEIENMNPEKESDIGVEYPEDAEYLSSLLGQCGYMPLMDKLYLQKYFADSEKEAEVTKLVYDLIDCYKDILGEEDWLLEETRDLAIEKLENMTVNVITPGNIDDYDDLVLAGYKDGGNLFDAIAKGFVIQNDHVARLSAIPDIDRQYWDDFSNPTTTLNAFNYLQGNKIFILAGYMACEDVITGGDTSYEEMLAIVGVTVGHEISHAFDGGGTKYDKYGRNKDEDGHDIDWMDTNSRTNFSRRADKVAAYYSLIRPVPGEGRVTGSRVMNEAIADMGGMKATLKLADKKDDFDYDEFFKAFSLLFATQFPKDTEDEYLLQDTHPLAYLRINITLQQFDEFLDCYDITDGDGMYLEKDRRINVW